MTKFYSSAKEVIAYTGVRPEALRCDSDAALESLLESWLVQIKSLIDADRGKSYDTDTPAGIHNIAMRMCANMVALMQHRAQSPIVRVDDFTVRMVSDEIFTPAIRRDLMRFPHRSRFSMIRVGGVKDGFKPTE